MSKPRIGVFGLSGCWGEQITLLNCETELLVMLGALDVADFAGVSSRRDPDALLDIAFVEGSVGSARDADELARIRERSSRLIALGSCACYGGVAAMSGEDRKNRRQAGTDIYGATFESYDTTHHRPLSDFVSIDAAIPGCPVENRDLLQAVAALLLRDLPTLDEAPVCLECQFLAGRCLLTTDGQVCLGPLTLGGCGARCPTHNVPCIGCRGPIPEANLSAFDRIMASAGVPPRRVRRVTATFAPFAVAREEEAS